MGLLALMLLQHSRQRARLDAEGAMILREGQDRSCWDRRMIAEALALLGQAMPHHRPGPYQIQAAIAAAGLIRSAAAARFGEGSRPSAIVLTHGYFDHVGALSTLAEEWDVPVYAHELERP